MTIENSPTDDQLSPPARTTVLITGATGGIGLHLAREFARHGHPLVLVASIPHELETAASRIRSEFDVTIHTLDHDLRAENAATDLFAALMGRGVLVDILVNNAGVARAGKFQDTSLDDDIGMLRLNIKACVRLTKQFLPPMLERGRGCIVNTACLAGFEPGPSLAVYHATKAFVLSWSEALAIELEETPVTVTTLCPGPADTDFFAKADPSGAENPATPPLLPPAEIAEAAYAAIMRGERIVVPGDDEETIDFSHRFLPAQERPATAPATP